METLKKKQLKYCPVSHKVRYPILQKYLNNAYQSDQSGLHVLVFDGLTLADTVGDVKVDEFTWQVDSCRETVDHLH